MVDETSGRAKQRLYDAAARWTDNPGHGPAQLIGAAGQGLVDGLDSPALRELAGASVKDSHHDIGLLLSATLDELHIPEPGTIPPGHAVGADGPVRRPADDIVALAVTPAPDEWRGRSPEELAQEVCHILSQPPRAWRASWHAIQRTLTEPPTVAGRDWRRYGHCPAVG